MSKDSLIQYHTKEEMAEAIEGMLNLKNEWLEYVRKRKTELGVL